MRYLIISMLLLLSPLASAEDLTEEDYKNIKAFVSILGKMNANYGGNRFKEYQIDQNQEKYIKSGSKEFFEAKNYDSGRFAFDLAVNKNLEVVFNMPPRHNYTQGLPDTTLMRWLTAHEEEFWTSLSKLTFLKSLRIVDLHGVRKFPACLSTLINLESLFLCNTGVMNLPDIFPNLKSVHLANNVEQGQDAEYY